MKASITYLSVYFKSIVVFSSAGSNLHPSSAVAAASSICDVLMLIKTRGAASGSLSVYVIKILLNLYHLLK